MKDKCIKYWNIYSKYKETAEQHEFPTLLSLDFYLTPRYKSLINNFDEEKGVKFIKGMEIIFEELGIEYD